MPPHDWLIPDWSAPAHVRAVSTTRQGGVSRGDYFGMNPAAHVHDDEQAVMQNRSLVQQILGLRNQPHWLDQYHSTRIVDIDRAEPDYRADGSTVTKDEAVCVVMTADCLPVLLTDRKGQRVAALHAGWRGLADGILEAGVQQFSPADDVLAWLGPAIGPEKFVVGEEVLSQLFTITGNNNVLQASWCRKSVKNGKWLVDIYKLASLLLQMSGVAEVSGGGYCTFTDEQRFFSYRRQGDCGRMATLIWLV
ncbi:MAG: peptidoglycan editing factor PgeF [Gammaproteobacteria bacterium]|nr:MAG: peptidoglycan editing factor PgeF [Gammaproteobacteria bacterium]